MDARRGHDVTALAANVHTGCRIRAVLNHTFCTVQQVHAAAARLAADCLRQLAVLALPIMQRVQAVLALALVHVEIKHEQPAALLAGRDSDVRVRLTCPPLANLRRIRGRVLAAVARGGPLVARSQRENREPRGSV